MLSLLEGDCLEVLRGIPDASVDSIVTDPPYDLTANKKGGSGPSSLNADSPAGKSRIGTGFMGKAWDGTGIAFRPDVWLECLRVLKPGGHLLAFGGTRTYHRMACAIEDAGFEIRDSIHWMYGSGFPKSLDVSKAIDKAAGVEREVVGPYRTPEGGQTLSTYNNWQSTSLENGSQERRIPMITAPATDAARQWEGWGTALKPSHEPIVVARKPLAGTVAENVLHYGTGALNIGATRVGTEGGTRREGKADQPNDAGWAGLRGHGITEIQAGRWPPNTLLSHSPDCSEQACVEGCPVFDLDEQSGETKSVTRPPTGKDSRGVHGFVMRIADTQERGHNDSGGASRFFPVFRYQAKPSTSERSLGLYDQSNIHPTVKPLDLMGWLVRLVTPKKGRVLDPFMGSGSTGVAAIRGGFEFTGIEREPEYFKIAQTRISAAYEETFDFTRVDELPQE